MNKLLTLLTVLLFAITSFSQVPEKLSYQAIVRNADGNLVSETQIGMQISILQTSTTGTTVYQETHTVTTNVNGLATLEIGTGIVINGDFASIDWGSDSYFIKSETDLEGGSNYTISGTSQLLSVPYALHAKKADNVFSGDYNDLTNKPASNAVKTYEVGDFAHGGIVFWVDESAQHGLVCAKTNQGSAIKWFAGTFGNTQSKDDGLYSGKINTATILIYTNIVVGNNGGSYAAKLCNDLQLTENGVTYGDWFLPSKYELNLMFLNKTTINATATANGGANFVNNVYWTSTEQNDSNAWIQDFSNGNQSSILKNFDNNVRAIRAF